MKYCQKTTIKQCYEVLKSANTVAIFAHTRPDGDTVGACVGLRFLLEKMGKTCHMFCDTALGNSFKRFPEAVFADSIPTDVKFDLYVAVDCGDLLRTGIFANQFDRFNNTMVIDHHCGEPYAKYSCLMPYASTCEMVLDLYDIAGIVPDNIPATYLYLGLCTDTGNFSNSATDQHAFLAAAKLVGAGADIQKISLDFFRNTTFAENKLLAVALKNMRSYFDGKLILTYVLRSDLEQLGLADSSTAGFVQYAINCETAKMGVSLVEHANNVFKVSTRGKEFDVRSICTAFGGGGHLYASGCMISGFLEDVIEKIVREASFTI